MKVALFLYPITPYLDALHMFGQGGHARLHERAEALGRIMDQRYRRRGWRIVWALFSCEDDPTRADVSLLAPQFDLRPEDGIAVVPLSFKRHCTEKVYPDARRFVRSLGDISRLAVCGFHCDDCVEKIAKAAYRMGIQAKVHDDLTEHFFVLGFMGNRRDDMRARPAWLRIAGLLDEDEYGSRGFRRRITPLLRKSRRHKPWLLQF